MSICGRPRALRLGGEHNRRRFWRHAGLHGAAPEGCVFPANAARTPLPPCKRHAWRKTPASEAFDGWMYRFKTAAATTKRELPGKAASGNLPACGPDDCYERQQCQPGDGGCCRPRPEKQTQPNATTAVSSSGISPFDVEIITAAHAISKTARPPAPNITAVRTARTAPCAH